LSRPKRSRNEAVEPYEEEEYLSYVNSLHPFPDINNELSYIFILQMARFPT
jgi:hypothetical protein